ncbi:beta-glucoside-specific PTS transporter subunit IIABC [Bacillus glycinifermentans]|uniref:beta-glucoside-specific PTS transporter subunit IIABC n=1 Tax=Bacillus glycinifermentans TaxID=1664069 RepID=UPI001FF40999|nr:beta-glucoside-specific PTS transporter subunit IIABC [Bacillus glycinifermentans]UOY90007.1 beta-glucoside-specific PTS transporter subunit IIABC [Bacillus glycinifermentans]
MDYKNLAAIILEKVGGKENVSSVTHCATRLRFNLKDDKEAETTAIKNTKGVVGVVNSGGQYQVIIGNDVSDVYKQLVELGNLSDASNTNAKEDDDKGVIAKVLDTIAGMFTPIVPVLAGAGMLKALVTLLITFKLVTPQSQNYQILDFMGDSGFYFLPILLASTAAKKFKVNQYLAMVIGGILLHPTFISMVKTAKQTGQAIDFIGLHVGLVTYSTTVIPIILAIWFMSYVEPFANRITPKSIRIFGVPLLTLLIVAPVTLIAIGPLGNYLGIGLGAMIAFLDSHVSWLVPTLVGAFTPLLVMTGMHYGLIPIGINMLATKGYDTVAGPGMMVSNIAQGAAALAVALRTKNANIKTLASSTGITAILGITEPALYGVNLRYKRPLIASIIGGGVAGLFIGIMGVRRYAQVSPSLESLPAYIGPHGGFAVLINAIIGCVLAFVISFAVSFILGIKEESVEETKIDTAETKRDVISNDVIYSPLKGKAVELKEVDDAVFSEGILGKGVAIIPAEGKVFAPIDGTVTAFFDTHHAIGITGANGSEILIHVGIDTVNLGGRHYTSKVKKGQIIKKGDLLLEFDIDRIKEAGYDTITPFIVTNSADYKDVLSITGKDVEVGEALLKLA